MRKKIFLIILIITVGFSFAMRRIKYNEFHAAVIKGTIDTLYQYKFHGTISVNYEAFMVNPVSLNNGNDLYQTAKIGDSLFKSANNDTLKLIHNNKKYLYTVLRW